MSTVVHQDDSVNANDLRQQLLANDDSQDITAVASGDDDKASLWLRSYLAGVKRWRHFIVGWWLLFFLACAPIGIQFLDMSDDRINPPYGTRAFVALNSFAERFPAKSQMIPELVLIESLASPQQSVLIPELATFARQIENRVLEWNNTHHNVMMIDSWYRYNGTLLDDVKVAFATASGEQSFMVIWVSALAISHDRYVFLDEIESAIKEFNPMPDLLDIGLTGFDTMAYQNTASTKEQIQKIDSVTMPIAFMLLAWMVRSWRLLFVAMFNMGAAIIGGFAIMVLVIWAGLPNPESTTAQLMEVLALAMSIDYSLFLLRRFRDECKEWRLAKKNTSTDVDAQQTAMEGGGTMHTQVISHVAVSSGDEAADIEAMVDNAVFQMVKHAGHVVIMAGSTIVVVFLGYGILPANTLRMDGAACTLSVMLCMLINLTNTPALLFLFPRFFSTFGINGASASSSSKVSTSDSTSLSNSSNSSNDSVNTNSENGNNIDDNTVGAGSESDLRAMNTSQTISNSAVPKRREGERGDGTVAAVHPMYVGWRFKITKKVTSWPCNLVAILVLYLSVVPLAWQIRHIDVNQNVLGILGRHTPASARLKRMFEEFPGGEFSPFYVMCNIPDYQTHHVAKPFSSLSRRLFSASQEIAIRVNATLCEMPEVVNSTQQCNAGTVMSPSLAAGQNISVIEADLLLSAASACDDLDAPDLLACHVAKSYEYLFKQSVNVRGTSMLITIVTPYLPFESQSSRFIDNVYTILDDVAEKYSTQLVDQRLEFHLAGFEVAYDATTRSVYGLFPTLIGVTCLVVFTVLGFLLNSYFVPIRLALTLVLPAAAVFGLAVLVYQDGLLDWTGIEAVATSKSGFFWYIPVLVVTMILGLAIDYDVLLISRVMERRAQGYEVQAAITKAVCETGGTIASAGCIMCLAFGGMLLSDQGFMCPCIGILLGMNTQKKGQSKSAITNRWPTILNDDAY